MYVFPDNICFLASLYASINTVCFSETIRPAAAFKQTAFEKSLSSPLNISNILFALNFASSPSKSLNSFASIFSFIGSINISEITIDPKELNINADKFDNLLGDDAKFNANKMIDIFKGEDNDFSKAVCLNAAAGLIVAEKHSKFITAYEDAREHILTGKAFKHLNKIRDV